MLKGGTIVYLVCTYISWINSLERDFLRRLRAKQRMHPVNYTLPGNNWESLFTGYVGIFPRVLRNHSKGLTSLILQVPRKEYNIAALLAPLCEPANG